VIGFGRNDGSSLSERRTDNCKGNSNSNSNSKGNSNSNSKGNSNGGSLRLVYGLHPTHRRVRDGWGTRALVAG